MRASRMISLVISIASSVDMEFCVRKPAGTRFSSSCQFSKVGLKFPRKVMVVQRSKVKHVRDCETLLNRVLCADSHRFNRFRKLCVGSPVGHPRLSIRTMAEPPTNCFSIHWNLVSAGLQGAC